MNKKLNEIFGKETKAAIKNFNISDKKFQDIFIKSLIEIKRAAAVSNITLKNVDTKISNSIIKTCDSLLKNYEEELFPLDVFQTGSGTSTNMNVNEVIASLSSSPKISVHPNDHINWGQSSNCVIPSAINISNRILIDNLIKELVKLKESFDKLAKDNKDVIKIGRTHLQDAVPMSFAQELSAFSKIIEQNINRINNSKKELEYLTVGGTAIGTGIASHKYFSKHVVKEISQRLNINFKESQNKFSGISTRDEQVSLMSNLATLASSLIKISNDLRILSSGPNTGIGEITFDKIQAGSSIMPGKSNPVIMEMMLQVSTYIIGNSLSVNIANQNGPLQLNMMMPLIAYLTIDSIEVLTKAISTFRTLGLEKIIVNKKKIESYLYKSSSIITILKNHPKFGYDLANEIVMEANQKGKSVLEIIKSKNIIKESELKKIFNFKKMI